MEKARQEQHMLFAIDLDGTIAGGPIRYKLYSTHQNEFLQLGIAPDVLDALPDYNSFLQLPQVLTYRTEYEERFQESYISCLMSSHILLALDALPGAQEGVAHLSRVGKVRYYTKRGNQEATEQWLALKQFPNPDDVVSVKRTMHKLGVAHLETAEAIVLIDDRFRGLTQGIETLLTQKPEVIDDLRKRLTLVAFDREAVPESIHGIRALALPSWERIDELVLSLESRVNGMRSL